MVKGVTVLAVLLYAVQSLIRLFIEVGKIRALVRHYDRAYRSSERDVHILAHKFLCGFKKLVVYVFCLVRDNGFIAYVFAIGDKFIAAHTTCYISRPYSRPYYLRKSYENLISHRVTVKVIYQLEAVKVYHHKRTGNITKHGRYCVLRGCLVKKSGHRVGLSRHPKSLYPLDI